LAGRAVVPPRGCDAVFYIYDWTTSANTRQTYGLNALNQVATSNSYSFSYDAKGDLTSDGVNA